MPDSREEVATRTRIATFSVFLCMGWGRGCRGRWGGGGGWRGRGGGGEGEGSGEAGCLILTRENIHAIVICIDVLIVCMLTGFSLFGSTSCISFCCTGKNASVLSQRNYCFFPLQVQFSIDLYCMYDL